LKKATILWTILILTAILLYGLADPELYAFPKCPFRSITGFLCPGCGSQRAMHHLLHGRIATSFQLNQLFIPFIVYAIAGAVALYFFPVQWPKVREKWYGEKAAYIALTIILLFWVGRNLA